MLRLIFLFPHLSLLRNLSSIWALPYIKNIHKIARDNFNNILVKVKTDIQRWKNLKVSLQGRISTVKMNLLPLDLIFFLYATTFLFSPPGYFKEINSIISKFNLEW